MAIHLRNREVFERFSRIKEDELPLFEAAILIAQEEFPEVTVEGAHKSIAELAAQIRPRLHGDLSERYAAFGAELFGSLGFVGNRDDYYDPLNSYLPSVLERKTGIPLTLALVMIECGRELGLPLVGVGFPGHYLLRHDGVEEILIDPFSGTLVDRGRLIKQLNEPGIDDESIRPLLKSTGKRKSLLRLVSNLKHAYMLRNDFERALRTCEISLMLNPAHAASYRDRGLVYEKLELFHRAEQDLATYLELSPNDNYAPAVAEHLLALRNRVALFH